ncbi:MAG: MBL fold metallo-hydrolase [Planctomycetales bacterium]|nr:MBL fold metallo-hydrolase [Planctomycetales bacterium]
MRSHAKQVTLVAIAVTLLADGALGQDMTFDQIRSVLRNNPPTHGDPLLREEAIVNLDEYLKTNAWPRAMTKEFYRHMTGTLSYEISLPVPAGARIWQMYNHGFIVKTPDTTFAFDLTDSYFNVALPHDVLEQIDVLFTSHSHGDHSDAVVQNAVASFGGQLVTTGTLPYAVDTMIGDLSVVAYDGLHGSYNFNTIFRVTTPSGITVMHTGDTQTSQSLPSGISADILLVNAWMNESGSRSATEGVRNAINKIGPNLTIPGHIQELGHTYNPADVTSRVPYEWPLAVDDVPIPGSLSVLAWGEYIDYGVANAELPATAKLIPSGNYTTADLNDDGRGDVGRTIGFAYVGEVDEGINRIDRQMAKFDLPNLSHSDVTVKSAVLRFYLDDVVGTPQGPVSLWHSLDDNSLEELTTQFENDTYSDTLLDVVQPTDVGGRYYEVDVTDQVLADYAVEGRAIAFSAFRLQINEASLFEDSLSNLYAFSPPTSGDHSPELILTFVPEPLGASLIVSMLATAFPTTRFRRRR